MIPNLLWLVEDTKKKFPQAWKDAHTGNAHTEDFIRILASRAFLEDFHFGLNGKRGNPKDISDDALNYSGEGADFDPTNQNMPCTVIDVIGGAGGPNPFPTWAIVTDPAKPVGAAWVQPGNAPTEPDPPPVHVCFVPDYEKDLGGDSWFRAAIGTPLQADMALAGQPCLNEGSSVWFSRCIHDIFAACVTAGHMIDRAPIVTKYRNQWRAILGLPPLP